MARNVWIHFVCFGCIGTTTEVMFTAIGEAIGQWRSGDSLDLALRGHSYLWMFFIYGLAALMFPIFYPLIANRHVLVRLLVYMIAIFTVEYLAGAILQSTTGSCPWHYDSIWAIDGYIRLDYGPFWMAFGYGIEKVFLLLHSHLPVPNKIT